MCPSTASQPPAASMKVKWTTLGMVVFFLLSVVMTCCFIWQYRMPKLRTGSLPPSTHPPHTVKEALGLFTGTTFGTRPVWHSFKSSRGITQSCK